MNNEPKIGVTIRSGRKVVKRTTLFKSQVENALVDAHQFDVRKALLAMPTLRQGKTFKYKHGMYGVTLEPILAHIENY